MARWIAAALLAVAALGDGDPAPPAVPALRGLDPVSLGLGVETPGKPEISETRGRFRYLFADEESRKRFLADPVRHGIQFDGYCMRMGPLSGHGNPDRFAAHDGRLYLFASDACRERFLADPERFVERADGPLAGDEAARMRGAELMDLAVKGAGGEKALAAATTVRTVVRTTTKSGEKTSEILTTRTLRFPGTLRVQTDYTGGSYAWLLVPGAGYHSAKEGPPVGEDVREWMVREMNRQPIALLKAHLRGESTAVAVGAGKSGQTAVEAVAVSVAGATTILAVDPATGRIHESSWRGRSGAGLVPTLRRWSDFRPVAGLLLPRAVEVVVDGRPVADRNEIVSIEVNPEIPRGELDAPR